LEIYEEFKKPSFDEEKIKDLISVLKITDPNLKTRLSEEVIWQSDNSIKDVESYFFMFDGYTNYTVSGLALRAGMLQNENKILDCLKFLSDQNLVSKDHIAIIVYSGELFFSVSGIEMGEGENLSVLGATIVNVVRFEGYNVDENKTREIIRYYLGDKSQIEKAEAIIGYFSDQTSKEITLSNYLVSNMGRLLTREETLDKDAKSILKRFGLQFSDILDEKVKAEIYENFYLTT